MAYIDVVKLFSSGLKSADQASPLLEEKKKSKTQQKSICETQVQQAY